MMLQKFKFFEGVIKDTYIVDVQQGIRTLRATWRHEDIEDINTHHRIDAEAELTRLMSAQIAEEVDRYIIRRLTQVWNGGQRA